MTCSPVKSQFRGKSSKVSNLVSLDDPAATGSVWLSLEVQNWPPSMHVTIPVPNLPGWLPVTLLLQYSVQDDGQLSVSCSSFSGGPAALHTKLEDIILDNDQGRSKIEAILQTTRDIKQVIGFIARRMDRQTGVWKGIVDKPSF